MQLEVTDEVTRRRERRTSPITATSVAAVTTSMPGIVIIADPHVWDQVGGEQISEDLRVELVGLHTRVADRTHLLGMRKHDLADMRLKDPGDRQRVTCRLEYDPIVRREAALEQLKLLRRRRDPPRAGS